MSEAPSWRAMGVWRDGPHLAAPFLKVNALCVSLAALAGGMAHLGAACADQELYSLAIGDRLLPGSPVESWLWGPILIGSFVSWWFGFIAAPFYFAATLFGRRRSLVRPIAWFVTTGLLGWGLVIGWRAEQSSSLAEGWRQEALLSLLGPGYGMLGAAFAALSISRWLGRTPQGGKTV